MVIEDFIKRFESDVVFVQEGELSLESKLDDLDEWDSMAYVATIALVDSLLGVQMNIESLRSCETVGDIVNLIRPHF